MGGLISFGPDIVEAYGMAGEYVKRILNGESPSTMACSRPSRFKVYVNRATAQNNWVSRQSQQHFWVSLSGDLTALFLTNASL